MMGYEICYGNIKWVIFMVGFFDEWLYIIVFICIIYFNSSYVSLVKVINDISNCFC